MLLQKFNQNTYGYLVRIIVKFVEAKGFCWWKIPKFGHIDIDICGSWVSNGDINMEGIDQSPLI